MDPEKQDTLRKEVRGSIKSSKAEITASQLESLPYLNGVCNESLRLYPGVPLTLRQAMRPSTILGCHVPAGTRVVIVPYAINRSPHIWGVDAEKFVPERWIDGELENARPNNNGGATNNYAFLTFLHGPRSCIGQNFSRAELRCLVAALVGRFDIQMADPDETVLAGGVITLKPRNGMYLRLTMLDGWQ
jgi:cytochrome P450